MCPFFFKVIKREEVGGLPKCAKYSSAESRVVLYYITTLL